MIPIVDRSCRVCESTDIEVFLERNDVPVHQNFLFETAAAARQSPRGDLRMTVCRTCGFVFNAAFEEAKIEYGEDYDNNQICSPFFGTYVDGLVLRLVDDLGIRGKTIVEVGCGKGHFLKKVVAADAGNRGVGYDPSYLGSLLSEDGRIRFVRRYYDGRGWDDVGPDAVVCRHVIEHVADPAAMVRSIRSELGTSDALVVFETPCVEWILQNRVIWDFFYEHCSLFSVASLSTLFGLCGFSVSSVRHVFNGQYLWLEARPGEAGDVVESGHIVERCRAYATHEREELGRWRERVHALSRNGGVALWGAGAKGVTFANLVDPECEWLDCVVDLNPRKQGHFVAGTGHPIVDYRALAARGVRNVAIMNPNYERENRELAAQAGLDLNFIL